MPKRLFFRLMLAALVCASLFAQSANDADKAFVGDWSMSSKTPDGDQIPWALHIRETEGKYAGTLELEGGKAPAADFHLNDGKLHFKAPYQNDQYDIDVVMKEGALIGSWSGGGSSGETTGKRVGGAGK